MGLLDVGRGILSWLLLCFCIGMQAFGFEMIDVILGCCLVLSLLGECSSPLFLLASLDLRNI